MVDIVGDVAQVTIPSTVAGGGCDYYKWSTEADAALKAIGITPTNYNHQMYILPSGLSGCSWAGVGNVSGPKTWSKECTNRVLGHELGHNFGFAHASKGTIEYGDYSDAMGLYYWQFNSAHRHQAGWLAVEKIQTVSALGTYRLSPMNEDPTLQSSPQVIRIHRPLTNEYVYLSYRTNVGLLDSRLSAEYANLLNIHRYSGSGYSKTNFLGGVNVGGKHSMLEGDYDINVISKDATSLEFSLTANTVCTEKIPGLVAPTAEYLVKSGASISGLITVKNNDSVACDVQQFDLSLTPHASISATLNPNSLDLSYLSSQNAAFNLQVLTGAPSGLYTLPLKVINRSNPLMFVSANISVRVDNTAPSVPLNLSYSLRKNSLTLSYAASTDNIANGLSHYLIMRNGVQVGQVSGTSFVQNVSSGSYSYQVIAVDKAGNKSAASSALSVNISTSGGKPARN